MQFLAEDIFRKDIGGKVFEIHFPARVLDVEVAAVLQNVGGGDFPGTVVLFALVPPGDAVGEFFKLNRLRLRVVLPAFRERLLVVPDGFRGAGSIEEQEIRRNACIGSENAVGKTHDGVQVEVLQ